jgi:hypothetical protein
MCIQLLPVLLRVPLLTLLLLLLLHYSKPVATSHAA